MMRTNYQFSLKTLCTKKNALSSLLPPSYIYISISLYVQHVGSDYTCLTIIRLTMSPPLYKKTMHSHPPFLPPFLPSSLPTSLPPSLPPPETMVGRFSRQCQKKGGCASFWYGLEMRLVYSNSCNCSSYL